MKIPKAKYLQDWRNPSWRRMIVEEIEDQVYDGFTEETLMESLEALDKWIAGEDEERKP